MIDDGDHGGWTERFIRRSAAQIDQMDGVQMGHATFNGSLARDLVGVDCGNTTQSLLRIFYIFLWV